MKNTIRTLAALTLLCLASTNANAGFMTFDDRDPNTITVTAGDFEGGFSVDGVLLTIGLGNSNSVTLPDVGGHTFSASWIDLGMTTPGHYQALFALPSDPTGVTSGVEATASTDGFNGSLTGSFGGFTGDVYFFTGDPTNSQYGPSADFSFPFLSGEFIPEGAAVPEPGSLTLLGFGIAGLAGYAWRRRNKAAA